jgi:acyl-CoA synthetase (AMP-forming)/AMP-acid ligase II
MTKETALNPVIPAHLIELKATEAPEQEVLIFEQGEMGEKRLTYRDIYENSNKIARLLLDKGIGSGDTVVVYMKNHPEFVYSLIATNTIGAVMVPVDPRTRGDRLKFLITNSASKAIIATDECVEQLNEVIDDLPEIRFTTIVYNQIHEISGSTPFHNLCDTLAQDKWQKVSQQCFDTKHPLEIIYTSGTTGDPKGVVIKVERTAAFKLLATAILKYTDKDIVYSGLSLTHGNAQAVTLFPALILGIKGVFSTSFTRTRIWDICRKYGCTTFSLLGGMMPGIANLPEKADDADNPVRMVVNAGTPAALWEQFEERFDTSILEWYGAVEGGLAFKPVGVGPIGSFGKPVPGVMEFKVVDEDDNEVQPEVVGELISRMVQGETKVDYLGKPGASEEKTRGGWLRSGDMVHQDEDGWFFFDYRKGGGLRRSGDFIQPDYLETVIGQHPDISEVCVYGIPAASGAPGESDIVAAVSPLNGDIDPSVVFSFCIEKLEKSNIPSYIQIVDAIPKTVSEKHQPRLLKEQFERKEGKIHEYTDFA